MDKNMNTESKEVKEVTIFDKKYATKDLTNKVVAQFVACQRMATEMNEANYKMAVIEGALTHAQGQLQKFIEEDKIAPMLEEAVVESE